MSLTLDNHPCFNAELRKRTGRIHLPVAPKCNVLCNFCNRKYDCLNESRPGVTSAVLSPGQAVSYLREALDRTPNVGVVGIAGPGDPFANPKETMETLRRVRAEYPDMLLCVASNGLEVAPYAEEMGDLGVSHVTVTINAVDPGIASQIYGWIRHGKRVYRGLDAGKVAVENQLEAIRAVKRNGMILKINTIVIPGVNDHHVEEVSKVVASMGADVQNCMALQPVAGTRFENVIPPTTKLLTELRKRAGEQVKQMSHCARCRADAAGLIHEGISDDLKCCLQKAAKQPLEPEQKRPYVAVSSREGMLVNQHLGEAESLLIFGPTDSSYQLVGTRSTPPSGGANTRWEKLADALPDCKTVLCAGAGNAPTAVLKSRGIEVIMMNGMIDEALEAVFAGRSVRSPIRKHRCGSGCGGDGMGCS